MLNTSKQDADQLKKYKQQVRKEAENKIRELVGIEFIFANDIFGPFNSEHEGYAVLLEEVEELKINCDNIESYLRDFWWEIKFDNAEEFRFIIDKIKNNAINAALEAIQVAAMCDKFQKLYKGD